MCHCCCGNVPFFLLSLWLLIGQHVLTLGGYIDASRFDVHVTFPDGLHMPLDMDETISVYGDFFLNWRLNKSVLFLFF